MGRREEDRRRDCNTSTSAADWAGQCSEDNVDETGTLMYDERHLEHQTEVRGEAAVVDGPNG